MSTTEFIIISVAVGLVIVGIPLFAYVCYKTNSPSLDASVPNESTPLQGRSAEDTEEIGDVMDSHAIISRILSAGVILHTTKGPKKVILKLIFI